MKRPLLCIIMFAVMTATAVGQTQQGYVKTRGKLAADGKSVVPGVRLSNALVTIENRSPVKSGVNGAFSFTLPTGTNRYRLLSAELKGYTLADPDAVRQMHTYSKDLPLIVVLEDMKQREADLEAARKSVRNVMKREIRKKQDELDSLRDAQAITQAKYDSLVHDFWEYRQSSEKLVNEMAERYVSTDYDQLDDFNRQVQAYIESGQLTKADSMIRSKGSLEERFNRVKQYESTNSQRETEIQQQQEALDKSRQYTQKEKEDLSNDLFRQHLIFLQQPMMQDSALYCLKMRADLDTTNMNAVWNYAYLAESQRYYNEAEYYYLIFLHAVSYKNDIDGIARVQNNLGNLYHNLHDYANSERYLKSAIFYFEKLFASNPNYYRNGIAMGQLNLGLLYNSIHDYTQSEKYLKLALENSEKLFLVDSNTYRIILASTKNNLGLLYNNLHDYVRSELYYKQALEDYKKLFNINPDVYRTYLAKTQNNLGNLYSDINNYIQSEDYYRQALANREVLFKDNPNAFRNELACNQDELGRLYCTLHDYARSEQYHMLALENFEILFADHPDIYRDNLATTQYNLGYLYSNINDDSNSEKYYKLAYDNYEKLFANHPNIYQDDLARTQNNLGFLYNKIHDYVRSERFYKMALVNFEQLFVDNPDIYRYTLSRTEGNLGKLYLNLQEYANSEIYYKLALKNVEICFMKDSDTYRPSLAITQKSLGNLYFYLHNYTESERYYKQTLSSIKKLYDLYPNKWDIELAETYWNLMLLYAEEEKEDMHDTCLVEALKLFRNMYVSDSFTYKPYVIELQNRSVLRMLMKGKIDEAIALAKENLILDKTNETTISYLAECLNDKAYQYAEDSNYADAIKTIDEAICLKPQEANYYDSKGEMMLMIGRDQEALKMWKKVIELDPKFLEEDNEYSNLYDGLKARGLIK